jgi:spore maturation protein SpmA
MTMSRIFVALVLMSFLAAAARHLLVTLPDPCVHLGYGHLGDAWYVALFESMRSFVDLTQVDGKPAGPPMATLGRAIFDWSEKAVLGVALKQLGGITLMLGLVKVVEVGGGLDLMAWVIRPVMVRLFPDVPPDHPAMGAMILNIAANMVGLNNAATPFGLKAMIELDKLNPHRGAATNAMCMFLAINTSGVTLLATDVVIRRRALGSDDPAGIIGTTLLATCLSTVAAVVACKLLARFFPTPPPTDPLEPFTPTNAAAAPAWVPIAFLAGLGAFITVAIVYADVVSAWLMPAMVAGFVGFGAWRGVPVYETFLEGAKEGFGVAMRIVPYLVAILACVGMVLDSGLMEGFASVVGPLTRPLGLPPEALPMALVRPLSGSGAGGVLNATLANPATGPDTYVGYLVSTISGSSETTFYVLSVYFGSVGVQRIRHALACGLIADVFGVIGSVLAVKAYLLFHTAPAIVPG